MTMKRTLTIAFLFVLVTSCNNQPAVPPPAVQKEKPAVPPPAVLKEKYKLFGGKYIVEIETVGAVNVSTRVINETEDGKDRQSAEIKWNDNKMTIEQAKLCFNEQECGSLDPGDRIFVDKNGKLSVNGKQRP